MGSHRVVRLEIHVLKNTAYWVVSVDRGKGKRYVLIRGVLQDIAEPQYTSVWRLLSEASQDAVPQIHE